TRPVLTTFSAGQSSVQPRPWEADIPGAWMPAASFRRPALVPSGEAHCMARIDALLEIVHRHGASDLHIRPGSPPMIRVHGDIEAVAGQDVSSELIQVMLGEIMDDAARARLERDHDVDFAYEVPGVLRVRCNVF